MKTAGKLKLGLLMATVMLPAVSLFFPVRAQGNLLPEEILAIFNLLGPEGSGAAQFVVSRIQLALVIALGGIVLIAVVYAILATFKYIQSQGDSGKIEEAQKAIKAIFFGIGALLIAIVGIVVVFVFFGAVQPDPSLYQVCLSAPGSTGCKACYDDADPNADSSNCFKCNQDYDRIAKNLAPNQTYQNGSFNSICKER